MRYLLSISVLLWASVLSAQTADSVRLRPESAFTDGLYLSAPAMRLNQPDQRWDGLSANMAINDSTGIARLENLRLRNGGASIAVDSLWGFAIDGAFFLRLKDLPPEGKASRFAHLREMGRICLFRYEKEMTRMVEIKAYNPETGRAFRSGRVPRREYLEIIAMLDFRSGRIAELNRENLLAWIAEDKDLHQRVNTMAPQQVDLLRVVRAFNERNPVFFPK